MKQDLNRAGRPKPLRRTAARSFSLATKQRRFQEVEGRCEACGEFIGDGTDWRRAIYHHRRLVSDPNVSDKEARLAAKLHGPASGVPRRLANGGIGIVSVRGGAISGHGAAT